MNYDSLASGDESSPTPEDCHGDLAVRTSPLVEPGFGDRSAFPETDEQTEREYVAWAEAEAALLCVASGRAVVVRTPDVMVGLLHREDGRHVGTVTIDGRTSSTLPQLTESAAWQAAEDLRDDLTGVGPRTAA